MTLPLDAVRQLVAQSLIVITNSRITGTTFGAHMAEPTPPPDAHGRTTVDISQSTVKDSAVAGPSDLKVDRSRVTNLTVGEPQSFLGIPVKVWVGAAGGMGLIGLIAYIVGQLLNRTGGTPPTPPVP